MSIIITGMEMPLDCSDCPIENKGYCCAENKWIPVISETNKYIAFNGRPSWCPLIEIPPHGRLADIDALMERWNLKDAVKWGNKTAEQQAHSYSTMMMYEIADMIDDAPVIVREERT